MTRFDVGIRGQGGHQASVMSHPVRSAGLLPYRLHDGLEVLIAHPGGPYFARKDFGSWSVVKGLIADGEPDEEAAAREFEEETGWAAPAGPWIPLGETILRSRKVVVAWAVEHDFDISTLAPGSFVLHGSEYPEIDRVEWVAPVTARKRLNPAQVVFIDRIEENLGLNVVGKE
jgi:predicted NUDIX family NTP pyrophosphohydrolase